MALASMFRATNLWSYIQCSVGWNALLYQMWLTSGTRTQAQALKQSCSDGMSGALALDASSRGNTGLAVSGDMKLIKGGGQVDCH